MSKTVIYSCDGCGKQMNCEQALYKLNLLMDLVATPPFGQVAGSKPDELWSGELCQSCFFAL